MRLRKKIYIPVILILILAAGSWYYYRSTRPAIKTDGGKTQPDSPDRYYTVKRGEMIIGIRQGGFVNSLHKHKLAFEPHIATKLLWVIDENEEVKANDILARFEANALEETIENLKIEIDNLEKEIDIGQEELKILESTHRSALRVAADKVTDSDSAFRKYQRFERRKERDALELAVSNAKTTYDDALENYKSKKDEIQAQSASNAEAVAKAEEALNALARKRDDAENTLKTAELNLRIFKRFTHPNKMTALTNAQEQSVLEQEKARIKAASEFQQKSKSISNLRVRLRRQRERLKQHEEYVEQMQFISPVDGVVTYGDPDRRWGNPEVRPGMDVRRRQVLLTIPDMSKLIVEFDLPEQFRSQVKLNDRVVVRPESLTNVSVNGKLMEISQLPINQIHWDSNSPKIYKSKVSMDEHDPRMVSGMSVQLEVITEVLKNVLYVPVEAVYEDAGKFIVYKRSFGKPVRKEVTIGKANDSYVEIIEGLEEGNVVYLYRPFQRSQSGG